MEKIYFEKNTRSEKTEVMWCDHHARLASTSVMVRCELSVYGSWPLNNFGAPHHDTLISEVRATNHHLAF